MRVARGVESAGGLEAGLVGKLLGELRKKLQAAAAWEQRGSLRKKLRGRRCLRKWLLMLSGTITQICETRLEK